MNGHTYTLFYVISFTVLSISAADVFIINAKPSERSPLSVSIERSLHALQELFDGKADEEAPRDLSINAQKPAQDDRYLLRPASSRDLTKNDVADLLRLIKAHKNAKNAVTRAPRNVQYRLFRNMYSVPKKLKTRQFKKAQRPYRPDSSEKLQPFINFLLSKKIPKPKLAFQDMTRFDSSNNTEDFVDIGEISRNHPLARYSRDYIDFDSLKFRRKQDYPVKAALRIYGNDGSSEATKSKRFEIIKNKHNVQDIKSSETDEDEYKKKKVTFKKKRNKHRSNKKRNDKKNPMEDAAVSLSSDNEKSKERIRHKFKKQQYESAETKQSNESDENDEWHDNDEEVGLYLQGNKLTVYPPVAPDSSDESSSDDTRRRGDRLPYFLPKRYHWNMDDIYDLGYFFFNGPKGVSLENESD